LQGTKFPNICANNKVKGVQNFILTLGFYWYETLTYGLEANQTLNCGLVCKIHGRMKYDLFLGWLSWVHCTKWRRNRERTITLKWGRWNGKAPWGFYAIKKVLLKLKGKFYSTAVSDAVWDGTSIRWTGQAYTLAQSPQPYSTHTNNISMFLNVDRVLW
jgi:hypothetical protein